MKIRREILDIDDEVCDSCGKCIKSCVEGALRIVDGKMRLFAEKFCDGCGACVEKCPLGALTIVERHAEEWERLVYVRC
jgi:ferredoxin